MADSKCSGRCSCSDHNADFKREALIFKALAHPSRLRMLIALRKRKLCVCELQKLVDADISTVSKHLKVLRENGLVTYEKNGNFINYILQMPCVIDFIDCVSSEKECRCSPG